MEAESASTMPIVFHRRVTVQPQAKSQMSEKCPAAAEGNSRLMIDLEELKRLLAAFVLCAWLPLLSCSRAQGLPYDSVDCDNANGNPKLCTVESDEPDNCKCIKNGDGVCMTLSRRGMPRYSRGSGTQNQFLPSCVDDCLPGSSLTYGPDAQTRKELAQCYVDWNRLERLNPQWKDPNWSP